MTWLSLFGYFFSLVAGFTIVFYTVGLFKQYQKKFLAQLLFFLIAYYIYCFINLVYQNISREFFQTEAVAILQTVHYSVVLMGLPFLLASLYFFISFCLEITDRSLSSMFTIWFFILSLTVLFLVLFGINGFINDKSPHFIETLLTVIRLGIIVVFFLSALKMFFDSREILPKYKKRGLRFLSMIYGGLFLIFFFIPYPKPLFYDAHFKFTLVASFTFLLHFIPILYLRHHLTKIYLVQSLTSDEHEELDGFFSHFDLSAQERVVVGLVLQGLKSPEIARKLSISTGTVKNHLYKIYRKAGINSRPKLIQMVRQYIDSGNPLWLRKKKFSVNRRITAGPGSIYLPLSPTAQSM